MKQIGINSPQFEAKIKPLFKRRSYIHLMALVGDWVIIIGAIILCLEYFNPLSYFISVLIIGSRMHALAVLMHDASHYRLLKNRWLNDFITNLSTMYPLFWSIENYRKSHSNHHIHLNTELDPDWFSKLGKKEYTFPKSRSSFFTTVFSYLFLIKGAKDFLWFLKRMMTTSRRHKEKSKNGKDVKKIVFFVLLVAILTIYNLWTYYLLFWIIPFLTSFFMFQYVRSVAEHFGDLGYDHAFTSTRTVKANLVERFFLAPHNINYHLEHHLYPGVPYYNLPVLHQMLMEQPEYKSKAHITKGYWSGLLEELDKRTHDLRPEY